MKLTGHSNTLETNVQNQTQDFGIGDISVVIDILRNRLYENKIQTLVQEYICNGRDSAREAGKEDHELDITIPTHFNPVFKVRDYGTGITEDRMANVFIKYGASTKRDSNKQTGGFGIGAKSAWSYTDSFTITTVVDGIKRNYVAHIGVNNNGRLDLVSKEKTDEKNGTEIQVAVKASDINEFHNAVIRAIYFWPKHPTLKGVVDLRHREEGLKISSLIEVLSFQAWMPSSIVNQYDNSPLMVIDGIPYVISDKLLDKCKTLQKFYQFVKQRVVFHIPNGMVEVAASRESIADSKKSIEVILEVTQKAMLETRTHISSAFGAVKTPGEYIQTYTELVKMFEVTQEFTKYGDYRIDRSRLVSDNFQKVKMTYIHCLDRRGRNKIKKVTRKELAGPEACIDLNSFNSVYFLNKEESTVMQNRRLRFLLANNLGKMILIEAKDKDVKTLDKIAKELQFKNFLDVQPPVEPKTERIKIAREKSEFCVHTLMGGDDRYKYLTLESNTREWLYIPIEREKKNALSFDTYLSKYKELDHYLAKKGIRICAMGEKALSMISKDKNFKPLKEWLDNYKPTKEHINYAKSVNSKSEGYAEPLEDLKGIEDKIITEMLKEYKEVDSKNEHIPDILLKKIESNKEVIEFLDQEKEFKKRIDTMYSLVKEFSYSNSNKKELVFYMNAKFNS